MKSPHIRFSSNVWAILFSPPSRHIRMPVAFHPVQCILRCSAKRTLPVKRRLLRPLKEFLNNRFRVLLPLLLPFVQRQILELSFQPIKPVAILQPIRPFLLSALSQDRRTCTQQLENSTPSRLLTAFILFHWPANSLMIVRMKRSSTPL